MQPAPTITPLNNCPIIDNSAIADQHPIANCTAVEDCPVANHHIVADIQGPAPG